jgi:hypothetical protein
MHMLARLSTRVVVAMVLIVAPLSLITATKAEAITTGTCVPYVSPITVDEFADRLQVYSDVNCNRAKAVTIKFFIRYRNISGWHITHQVNKSYASLNGAYIIGIKAISQHTVGYMYAETTVCYGSPKKCRSDSAYIGR